MEAKPIGKNILVKEIVEEILVSGIALSEEDKSQLRYKKAQVKKPGSDVSVINEGDLIYFDTRAGYTMFIDNETYTIISEKDVVVVL